MRPSSFKRGGGGFLNNVDSTFVGYQFVVSEESYPIKKGERKGELFTPLSLVPSFLVDGASEPVTQRLLVGGADQFGAVSDDGLTLEVGDGRLGDEVVAFIDSLVAAGFPNENFSDDPTTFNLEPVIGTRLRTVQEVNAEKTQRQGKQVNKTTGKSYDRKDLKVSKVYDVPAIAPVAAKKVAGKGVAKTAAKAKSGGSDIAVEAEAALRAVGAAKGGVIQKAKLRMALLTALTGKTPNRDAIIAYLGVDANLDSIAGVSHDADSIVIG